MNRENRMLLCLNAVPGLVIAKEKGLGRGGKAQRAAFGISKRFG
jgi:hypothetical protein